MFSINIQVNISFELTRRQVNQNVELFIATYFAASTAVLHKIKYHARESFSSGSEC